MNKRVALLFILIFVKNFLAISQDQVPDYNDPEKSAEPPLEDNCNGIFLSYDFVERTKLYPRLKNATAQAWAFKSTAKIINTGTVELKAWKMFIGFQHKEILVAADGAILMDGGDFPAAVGNGTYLSGSPQPNLKTSIETAGDRTQFEVEIKLSGTQFGVKPPDAPMPKTIRLFNDGFKCPGPKARKTKMYVCCVRDPKFKAKVIKTKFLPRQKGDLTMSYDVLQTYPNNYLVQVTMENHNPLGRLDKWNLTWEWMRGEFIYSMRGAYTRMIDYTGCIYGAPAKSYGDMDFSKVMNCERKPIIGDLPAERANDTLVGKLPFCCRNGSLLPTIMDETKSKAVFQMQVYKIPPDLNRTAIFPPEKWEITGVVNPEYKCGPPIRVDPAEFPEPSGLQARSVAISSWQIVCNITKPMKRKTRCCVSFSAYYNTSVIPCNTCACGCEDKAECNQNARAMLLPAESLLVPFDNRTEKAVAWAKLKKFHVPKPLPCGDNCGVSMNWHINTDYKSGWTARITLFNWGDMNFEDWFAAIQMKKPIYKGYENIYSFNGTMLKEVNNTIFFQGLKGLNFLVAMVNGSSPKSPKIPGKQQSVISFTKGQTPNINIPAGEGFPSRVLFNGEECELPTQYPLKDGSHRYHTNLLLLLLIMFTTFNL